MMKIDKKANSYAYTMFVVGLLGGMSLQKLAVRFFGETGELTLTIIIVGMIIYAFILKRKVDKS